ncbi:MAG: IMP dehydrogenase [Patescibacteria group bacterium]|nr:IMP dehydrogenase [Patescibacteria group bacterium]
MSRDVRRVTKEYIKGKVIDPVRTSLTFDDLTLYPDFSRVGPKEINTETLLTKGGENKKEIKLKIPLVSAAMDTVTEKELAIALALAGGIGIIHKNLRLEEQASQVKSVKRWMNSVISDPIYTNKEVSVGEVKEVMKSKKISGLPVLDKNDNLCGIITNRDVSSCKNDNLKVKEVMTSQVICAGEEMKEEEAQKIMLENRVEKLPIKTKDGKLAGMFTAVDIKKRQQHPEAVLDENKRLLVGAAVGDIWHKHKARVEALVEAGVDVIVIDTAHGHTVNMKNMLTKMAEFYPKIPVIAGNISTPEAVKDLVKWGADAIKVGQGPSAICTTRVVAGIGIPQMTAIMEAVAVAGEVPVIADGGIKYSGDIVKAIAGGASSVMIGSLFSGTDEAPGEIIYHQGKSYKIYRGMGSSGAMKEGSAERYRQEGQPEHKFVAEGIEGNISYAGTMASVVYQLIGGLRSGMGYCGCEIIKELKEKARFRIVTGSGLRESHPHDINIIREEENYRGGVR